MNNLAVSMALATAPSTAFAELRERPRFWFPLLVLVISTVAIFYWYYSTVDFEWLKDTMFGNNPKIQAMPEPQRAAALGMFTRTTLMWSSMIGASIFIPLYMLVQTLFLFVAAKITKVPLGFKHWFTMASWSSLPGLLGTIAAAIFLILSDTTQLSPGVLQSLSLNELVLHRPPGSPGEGLLGALNIPALLSWTLMVIGVRTWSQRSWLFSATFVLLPIVVIFALWALLAFR